MRTVIFKVFAVLVASIALFATTVVPANAATGPAAQVFTLLNQQRAANGLPALISDPTLDAAAQAWATHLAAAGIFEHSTSTWRDSMIGGAGWIYSGENIAAGYSTASSVMTAWMDSPGHRANILSSGYDGVGVGYALGGPYGYYWVQIFAKSNAPRVAAGSAPVVSGSAAIGQTLSASTSGWAGGVSLSWTWQANGATIPGATSATYVPSLSDSGRTITATVTGSRAGYYPAAASSASTSAVTGGPPAPDRITGSDRYDSAAGMSRAGFTPGVPVVYIASGRNFPDALSAAPAATLLGGPLLLTEPTGLPPVVRTELLRLNPARIVVVGGPASVSDVVLDALTLIAPTTRVDGTDRYAASRAIVLDAFTSSSVIYIATGNNFPDALTASAVAGGIGAPVLLVNGTASSIPAETIAVLETLGVTDVRIAGGVNSVTPAIQTQLEGLGFAVERLSGADRYDAGNAVVLKTFTDATTIYLTSGANFPDALAGAALAGKNGAPLFLTTPGCIPQSVSLAISALTPSKIVILGGPASVTSAVASYQRC